MSFEGTNWQRMLQALPAVERYSAAVLAVVCTLAIRLAVAPMLADRAPYVFFFLTIVLVKRLWGRGPSLLVTLLGGIAAWYFIVQPQFSFAIENSADALNLASYFIVGAGISFIGEASQGLSSVMVAAKRNIKFRVVRQTAVLAGAGVVLAGMVLLLERDFARTQDAEGWVVHTFQVINSAESVRATMDDANAGARRFLQHGNAHDLKDYNAAMLDHLTASLASTLFFSCAASKWDGDHPPRARASECRGIGIISSGSGAAAASAGAMLLPGPFIPFGLSFLNEFWAMHTKFDILKQLTYGFGNQVSGQYIFSSGS